jgi:HAD superfamily hydrolase (TIGR01509 family)
MLDKIAASLQAIVLDMDGVLVDTEPMHVRAFDVFMNEMGIAHTEKDIHGFIGYSIADNVRTINRAFGANLDVEEGVRRRDAIYLDMIRNSRLAPLPGIIDLIDYCHNYGILTALASSSSAGQVYAILDNLAGHPDYELNLRNFFHSIVTGDDVLQRKPAPDIYRKTLVNLGLEGRVCLAIEDSGAGVRSAKSAGLYCAGLRNHFIPETQLNNADWIISSVSDVVETLLRRRENFFT